MSLGDGRDLVEHRVAADVTDVRFHESDGTHADRARELIDGVPVLAGRDRDAAVADHPCLPLEVIRNDGFFQPQQIEGLQRAGHLDGLVSVPPHVGIGHQWEGVAKMLPHGLDSRDVLA